VFISYSHALDGALAPALQTGLEQFAKPWYQMRALRVFRDTTSLGANPGLWSSIETALASSAWLVLMASPEAARSAWVDREVAWWLANKSPQRVLVVLTEGEFAWGDAGEGDSARAALPPALRGALIETPRWVDLRQLRNVKPVEQANPQLQECVADLAAAVRQVDKDMLFGEHVRQHRRTMRLARGALSALVALLVAALVAAVVAVIQRNQAVTAQHRVIARGMVAQAERIRDQDPRLALQLGIAAVRIDPGPLATASLVQTLVSSRYRAFLAGHPDTVRSEVFSPDGRTLATGGYDGSVILWDLSDPTQPHQLSTPPSGHTDAVSSEVFSPDGRTLATGNADGTVILWDLSDRTQPHRLGASLSGHTRPVLSVAFSPDGRTLATGSDDHSALVWDLSDRTQPHQLSTPLNGHTDAVSSVAFSPDGRTLATGS
jgi:hypothetical protein